MHNYDHDIDCPKDRAMYKFLWCDYFHDSDILSVEMEGKGRNCVVMRLGSDRDARAVWKRFCGDYEKWHDYVESHQEQFIYVLKFRHVFYLDRRQEGGWRCDFLNARFKDTAILRRFSRKAKRQLYHLRIHTSDGFIDLVFGEFEIRRAVGRVNYSMNMIMEPEQLNDFEKEMTLEREYTALPEDDFDRFLLLERMYESGHPSLLKAARDCMNSKDPCEDAKPYAAYLLGKIGASTDIPAMMDAYFELEKNLLGCGYDYHTVVQRRQNILDAVELIRFREEEAIADAPAER